MAESTILHILKKTESTDKLNNEHVHMRTIFLYY